jgi:signal transduction histidine kinase
MRLTAADRNRDSIDDARRRLEDALSAIASDQGHGASLDAALDDLRGLWHPIVHLSHDVTPTAQLRLAEDPGLSRCVIEICREATSNAIRHGSATVIDITIGIVGDLVEIRICDNGDGVSEGALAGLGTQMLDETCFRWELAQRPGGGSELIALLA